MEKVKQESSGVSIHGNLINNLRYADGIDLINEKFDYLTNQIKAAIDAVRQAELTINAKRQK